MPAVAGRPNLGVLCLRRGLMCHHVDGWAWLWMLPVMLLWIAVFGVVVYGAVRLVFGYSQQPPVEQ